MVDTDPRVAPATTEDVAAVTDLWVALAAGQREHGATLGAEANRATVREWVARSVVTGELLVARDADDAGDADSDASDADSDASDADSDASDADRDAERGPVGFVGFGLERGDYERDATRGTVSNLFVVPERRGEGIGGALLDAAERALRERGADRVALEALADNDRAREFYADRGYKRHRVVLTKPLADGEGDGPNADG